jgi:thiamine kinase-like enzyme
MDLLDSADDVSGWRRDCIEAAICGLAELHAIWYGREKELLTQPWLGPVSMAHQRVGMRDLWMSLAEHARSRFTQGIGVSVKTLQNGIIKQVGPRWRLLERLPRTLIHNDFNPRNIALRREGESLHLCAYDWELATVGVPQHDLAEFLCFTLKPSLDRAEVLHYIDLHRSALERARNRSIDPVAWEIGFRLSLHDLLVDRFAMYAMIDRFRPQRFLTRVLSTWYALYELFPLGEAEIR